MMERIEGRIGDGKYLRLSSSSAAADSFAVKLFLKYF